MICHGSTIQVVTMQGNIRQSKKLVSQLHFDFHIESIGEQKIETVFVLNFNTIYSL